MFNRILARIRTGAADGIVVYRVDRFARSLLGALSTLEGIARAAPASRASATMST